MEKVVKFHTCSHHTFGMMEKVVEKGMDLGSLKRALIILKLSSPKYHK
jgi:hypothetical protein